MKEMVKVQKNDLELNKLERQLKDSNMLARFGLKEAEAQDADLSQVFMTNPLIKSMPSRENRFETNKRKIDNLKGRFSKRQATSDKLFTFDFGTEQALGEEVLAELEQTGEVDLMAKYNEFKKANFEGIQDAKADNSLESEKLKGAPKDPILRELWLERELDSLIREKERDLAQLRAISSPEVDALVERMKHEQKVDDPLSKSAEFSTELDRLIATIEEYQKASFEELNLADKALIFPEITEHKTYHQMITELSNDPKIEAYLSRKQRAKNVLSNIKSEVGKITRQLACQCSSNI